RYGRRDWFLRRLLAASDALCLGAAMALAIALVGGVQGHPFEEYLPYGLVTLPAWVVLFNMYRLYERDAKRLTHSTLDDLPSLFHGLLLGSLLLWCWFALVAPARLVSSVTFAFGALAMVLVPTGRALSRAGFMRRVPPER